MTVICSRCGYLKRICRCVDHLWGQWRRMCELAWQAGVDKMDSHRLFDERLNTEAVAMYWRRGPQLLCRWFVNVATKDTAGNAVGHADALLAELGRVVHKAAAPER